MTTGLCFGTYSPLQRGDLDLIMQAKKQCDACVVVVFGTAVSEMTTLLGESTVCRVVGGPEVPEEEMVGEALKIADSIGKNVRWYVRPCFRNMLTDREIVVGGEDSRLVAREAAPEGPCHRFMITGWASEGKTTLAQDIATYFHIPYVPEAARVYMEAHQLKDEELTEDDFLQFIRLQNELTDGARDRAVMVDTDNITTLAYTISYAADPDVSAITEASIRKIREEVRVYDWEKIYVLPPKNMYVDDGLRYMKQADMDVRTENFELLLRLLEEYGLKEKVCFLRGSFWENFLVVKNDVAQVMG